MKYLKALWTWIVTFFQSVSDVITDLTDEVAYRFVQHERSLLIAMTVTVLILSLIILIGSDRAFEPGPTILTDRAGVVSDATMSADLAAICDSSQPAFSLSIDGQVIELFISE